MRLYTLSFLTQLERSLIAKIADSRTRLTEWKRFPDGTAFVRLRTVGRQAVVLGRLEPPADNILETLLLLDTLRRAGAKRITLVLPYFAYGRQDTQKNRGDAFGAATMLRLCAAAGASRIITTDLHNSRIAKGSGVPVINVSLIPDMAAAISKYVRRKRLTVVAPDEGSIERARSFAKVMAGGASVAWFAKERTASGKVRLRRAHGTFSGKTAVLIDDILDTGSTVQHVVQFLRHKGFDTYYLCITHPVFSGNAPRTLQALAFKRIVVSDTIPLSPAARRIPGIYVIGTASRIAEALIA